MAIYSHFCCLNHLRPQISYITEMQSFVELLVVRPIWFVVLYEICLWAPVLLPLGFVVWKRFTLRNGALFVACTATVGYLLLAVLSGLVFGLTLIAYPVKAALLRNGLEENALLAALADVPDWFRRYWFLIVTMGLPLTSIACSAATVVIGSGRLARKNAIVR
jgi:hypothetical protein